MALKLLCVVLVLCATIRIAHAEALWYDCPPFFTMQKMGSSQVDSKYRLQCLNISVPLSYDNPGGKQITAFTSRLTNPNDTITKKGQLWLLQGGPGGSGESIWPFAHREQLMDLLGGTFDLMFPDHRGVGFSTPLYCPNPTIIQAQECIDYLDSTWGEGLHQFTSSNAARDLHSLVTAATESGVPVYIYGVSYGTYWLQRYLQIYSSEAERPRAVILDGIVSPDKLKFLEYDFYVNTVGHELMAWCEADLFCNSAFKGVPPISVMASLFDKLLNNATTCFDQLSQPLPPLFSSPSSIKQGLNALFQQWLFSQTNRILIPPTIFRLTRCSTTDISALNYLMSTLSQSLVSTPYGPNYAYEDNPLALNIIQSEMLSLKLPPPTLEQIITGESSLYFTGGSSVSNRMWYDYWDRYTPDEYANNLPSVSGLPLLMLNGNLDPQTPLYFAEEVYNHYAGPTVTFEIVNAAVHCTIANSPVDNSDTPCGLQMVVGWILSDTKTLDTTCLDHLVPIDWAGTTTDDQQLSLTTFGVTDMWQL
ncbi:alpha/beta hydrolase fold [Pelomyxa schiedti]|nr:alpha/beta hydrolase fold [Pelomyxa schiedti]